MESPRTTNTPLAEATPVPSPQAAERPTLLWLRKRTLSIAAGILTMTALAGTPSDAGRAGARPATQHHQLLKNHDVLPAGAPACPVNTLDYLHAAEQILDQSQNPDIAAYAERTADQNNNLETQLEADPLNYDWYTLSDATYRVGVEEQFLIEEKAAHKDGVTVYDPTNYLVEMNKLSRTDAPFEDYLTLAQLYTQQFGITLRLASADDQLADNMTVPERNDLETGNTAKMNLVSLVSELSTMPQEYIKLADVHTILVAANRPDTNGHVEAAALTWLDGHNTIVIGANTLMPSNTLRHEVYHDVDGAECSGDSGARNDQGYSHYNEGNVYNAKGIPAADSETTTRTPGFMDLKQAQYEAEKSGDLQTACNTEQMINTKLADISLVTAYAGTNEVEDKAETGENLADPFGFDAQLNPQTPHLRNKFKYLFARLLYYAPNVAKYFADIAYRTDYPAHDPCNPRYSPKLIQEGKK